MAGKSWPPQAKPKKKKPTPKAVGTAMDTDGDGKADVIVDDKGNKTKV